MNSYMQVKFESARELKDKIMVLCLQQCNSPTEKNLLRIGSLLGDFANNLRATLNYTTVNYAQTRIQPLLPKKDYDKLKRFIDFPWAENKGQFDSKAIIPIIRNNDATVYQFLEKAQPYHEGNEWLKYLMQISNTDKHVIINEVRAPQAADMVLINRDNTTHRAPTFFGDKLLIMHGDHPHFYSLPYYYYPYGAFAIMGERWILFLTLIGDVPLGLTRFLESAPDHVQKLVKDFTALF